ncbi:hypothetical protein ACFRFH_15395 [Leifsonia sp. NPDC056824]|uniref:hypothetical protein n=1 Tax=Leifsonia sp. NPDC056824 TaxID=3345953 RepID=UPI003679AC2F
MNPTKRASWIVRVTQTNQYNWILLVIVGLTAGVFSVGGLIAGNIAGALVVLLFGASMAGPGAWWLRRATRIPAEELQPEPDQGSPEEP